MPRFYVPEPRIERGVMSLQGGELRHLRRVLRLKIGDRLTLFNGRGKEYEGVLIAESPSSALIKIEEVLSPQRESPLEVTLAQSLLKREKMEYVIQKATELGIKTFIPFFSSRSVPLLDKAKRGKRSERWEKIAIEACKQCGRTQIPKVEAIRTYSEVMQMAPSAALCLLLCEKGGRGIKEVLRESQKTSEIFFLVGPEGGMSMEEVDEAKRANFIPVTMGKRILRSETASLSLLSILQYEWGDMG